MMHASAVLFLALAALAGSGTEAGAQTGEPLTLADAVRSALATHPLTARALAERDRATALADQARATRIPRVTTEWSGMRHQEPMIVAPLHSFDPANVPAFDRTLINGQLSAAWVLYDGGGRSARIARAETGESVADEGVRAAESELIAATSRAFLAVLDARAAERALTGQIEALESERTRTVRLEAEGRVAHVEVLRANAGLARSRADMAAARAGVARDEAELARLLGSTPTAVAALALATPDPAEPSVPDRTALIAAAHRDNADLSRAALRLAAAEAGRRNARSELIPTVALAGRYNAFGSGAGDFDVEWQGGLQLSWPVFTGGQRGARVAEADAEVALARQDLRLAQLRVESAVDAALATLAETSARVEALDAAVIQFEAVVGVEQLALDAGAGVQTDFLGARSALLESQTAAFQARHAAIAARIAVARATGELTLDWIDTELGRSR